MLMADKVLIICDKYYAEKTDNRKGGVGWETMITVYIKSRYALDWSADEVSDEEFNELLLQLFNCDAELPIGEIPDFIKEKLAR